MGGFFNVPRKERLLFEDNKPFSKREARTDLFCIANYKEGVIETRNGILKTVKIGQVGWSILRLSKKRKWSRGKTKNFLKFLQNEGKIEQHSIQGEVGIITIIGFPNGQQTEQQTDIKTNNKPDNIEESNKNNKGNNIYKSDVLIGKIVEIWNSYDLGRGIKGLPQVRVVNDKMKANWNRIRKQYTNEQIDIGFLNYIEDIKKRTPNSDYAKHRFTLQEFIKQSNGFEKFVNK